MSKSSIFIFGALLLSFISMSFLAGASAGNRHSEQANQNEQDKFLQFEMTRLTAKDEGAKQLIRKMQKDKDCPNPPCKGNDIINKMK